MNVLQDIITEKNNSACPVRITFIVGFLAIIGFTISDIVFGARFMEHAKDWISGLADYLGLGGMAIAGKNYTESKDGN